MVGTGHTDDGNHHQWNSTLPIGEPPLRFAQNGKANSVNVRDNIAPGDLGQTPLQFVYQPADCRLFYGRESAIEIAYLWRDVYDVAWGNGTCVDGAVS